MIGQGWRMLVEQLSVGRCISLPSNATGGAKAATWASGAYGRIRRQFNMPVGKFEGVEAVVARMAGLTYTMDAARSVTAGAIDGGEKPSVPSAMLKYHVTEMSRIVANDGMDVHGGKGICLGPRNYMGRGYQAIPIAITVEGANILTRSLIIFGQGAIRCHPFVLKEMNAARNPDRAKGVDEFDRALFGHIGFTISNAVRSFIMAMTNARFTSVPVTGPTRALLPAHRAVQRVVRVRRGRRDAHARRLPEEEREPLRAARRRALVHVSRLDGAQALREPGPARCRSARSWNGLAATCSIARRSSFTASCATSRTHSSARVMRLLTLPRGLTYSAPSDRLGATIADLVSTPTESRERLGSYLYKTIEPIEPARDAAGSARCSRRPPNRSRSASASKA